MIGTSTRANEHERRSRLAARRTITHELLDRLRKGRDGECSTQAADHRRLEHAYRRHVWWWAPHERRGGGRGGSGDEQQDQTITTTFITTRTGREEEGWGDRGGLARTTLRCRRRTERGGSRRRDAYMARKEIVTASEEAYWRCCRVASKRVNE